MLMKLVLGAFTGHALASSPTGLHDAAVSRGKLYFGTATNGWQFQNDTAYLEQLSNTHDFGQLVPAASMKMDATQPKRGQFDFTGGDEIVDLGVANGQILRCHAAVWHTSTPAWVTEGGFDNATLIEIMEEHIHAVLTHYKGSCYAWDVVNEPLFDNGTWRSSVWYETIGPAYVPIAFAAAAKADPDVKLYLNDYSIEVPSAKASNTVEIVKMVQEYGAKIDGVGLQAHVDLSGMPPEAHYELGSMPTFDDLVTVMQDFVALNVEVAITELDVNILTPGDDLDFEKQAEVYYNVTASCLAIDECVGVTIWDWADKYSWVPDYFPDMGEGHPWDENLEKKPAYDSIMKAFKEFGVE